MTYPNISPRLWLIQIPDSWSNVALIESNTPADACDRAARLLGLNVGPFRSMSTQSGRHLDQGGYGERFFAVNVTGALTLADADRLGSSDLAALVENLEDVEEFIAPIG